MGNSLPNLKACFFSGRRRRETAVVTSEPYDDGLGHSFCYRSKMARSDEAGSAAFRSISGASLSANAATPLSTAMDSGACAAFQSSTCFSSGPIEPAGLMSGPPDRPSLRRTLSRGLRRALTRPSVSADRLHWAQGRAGEDRVHVVVSEPQGSLFVGIYDGFNGPDATDYLLSNLYPALQTQLQGLLWEETHAKVLKALSLALKNTEEAFLETADMIASQNPELALMGSCVLVMLMKGEDLYLMNVGDSRAVLAKFPDPLINLDSIVEDSVAAQINTVQNLVSCQLTEDHSTSVEEEVKRIRSEHPEDASAIVNERVKGSLKVTRAFGAGFLKKPKWNNALLEMFRIDYVGTSPYITCSPFLFHHRLSSRDRFIILSSDGLYQYFTNEEAVSEVESFMSTNPAGDPAQHLVEEVLVRAAKNAGMDFHELLEISQGDRRRYHDDVSIIVISFEGRIWRSCM